jgi:hypothetical protein
MFLFYVGSYSRARRTDGGGMRGWCLGGWCLVKSRRMGGLRAHRTDVTMARCACEQGKLADGKQAMQARVGNGRPT